MTVKNKGGKKKKKAVPTIKTTGIVKRPSHVGGLGRGLDLLIAREPTQSVSASLQEPAKDMGKSSGVASERVANSVGVGNVADGRHIVMVPISQIHPSAWQPRRVFDEESLNELAESIRTHGIIQPLICRTLSAGGGYELIGGERRLRAATEIGLKEVPIIMLDVADRSAAELALVENLQREDLNVIEEAEGYRALSDKFNMTQSDIAERVGKARASISNTMRLLDLPDEVKQLLGSGALSTGHAKVLLGLDLEEEQVLLARKTVKDGWSVRVLEQKVARNKQAPVSFEAISDIPEDHLTFLLSKLHQYLGTGVRLTPSVCYRNGRHAKGKLEIDFYDNEDLSRLFETIGLNINE